MQRKAFDLLVAKEHNAKELGYYPLNRNLPAASKTTVEVTGKDLDVFMARSEISAFTDANITRATVTRMRHRDMPETAYAEAIDFFADSIKIATFTVLPRYQKLNGERELMGNRTELTLDNVYKTAETAHIPGSPDRISMRELRMNGLMVERTTWVGGLMKNEMLDPEKS